MAPDKQEQNAEFPIPADQRWFWDERWQNMEREADADIAAGHLARFDSVEEFVADLEDGD